MSSIPPQPSTDGAAPGEVQGESVAADAVAAAAVSPETSDVEPSERSEAEVTPEPAAVGDTAADVPSDASSETAAETAAEAASETPADAPAASAPDHSPAATAQLLKQRFPALFTGQPKPLKLRIQVDIQERAPGVFTKQALTAFFRRYTGSHAYLLAASRATHRYDLDGAPAGELSEEHRKIAVDELARRRSNTDARRAVEEEQRRNRATLLHDFERTTLTPANFCALKGISLEELDQYLGVARQEAAERAANPPAFERDRGDRGGPRRDGPGPRRDGGGAGPGPRRDGAGPGPRRDGAGPAPWREGAGPGPRRDGRAPERRNGPPASGRPGPGPRPRPEGGADGAGGAGGGRPSAGPRPEGAASGEGPGAGPGPKAGRRRR